MDCVIGHVNISSISAAVNMGRPGVAGGWPPPILDPLPSYPGGCGSAPGTGARLLQHHNRVSYAYNIHSSIFSLVTLNDMCTRRLCKAFDSRARQCRPPARPWPVASAACASGPYAVAATISGLEKISFYIYQQSISYIVSNIVAPGKSNGVTTGDKAQK